jgi:hypothetical protein
MHAAKVEPLAGTVIVVAGDHIAVGNLVAIAVSRLVAVLF